MEIRKFNTTNENEWNNFLYLANNSTLFDTLNFLNYHSFEKFNLLNLMIYEDHELLALLPAAIFVENGRKILKSPYGASVGGPIFKAGLSFEVKNNIISEIISYSKINNINSINFKLAPTLYYKQPNDDLSFSLFSLGFKLNNRWLTLINTLPDTFEQLIEKIPIRKRRYFNQALKNKLEFEIGNIDNLTEFYSILLQNRAKFNSIPTHNLKDLEYLFNQCSPRIKIFFTKSNNKKLAAGLVFELTDNMAYVFYLCHLDEGEIFRCSFFCSMKIQEYYILNNFKYIDFGPSTFNDMSINYGGIKFKEELGCKGYNRDEWIYDLI